MPHLQQLCTLASYERCDFFSVIGAPWVILGEIFCIRKLSLVIPLPRSLPRYIACPANITERVRAGKFLIIIHLHFPFWLMVRQMYQLDFPLATATFRLSVCFIRGIVRVGIPTQSTKENKHG
jgi:hypothetical protein